MQLRVIVLSSDAWEGEIPRKFRLELECIGFSEAALLGEQLRRFRSGLEVCNFV